MREIRTVAVFNHSPEQRPGKDRIRYLNDPITAKHLNETHLRHEKSFKSLVAANDYLVRGLQQEGDQALNDRSFIPGERYLILRVSAKRTPPLPPLVS